MIDGQVGSSGTSLLHLLQERGGPRRPREQQLDSPLFDRRRPSFVVADETPSERSAIRGSSNASSPARSPDPQRIGFRTGELRRGTTLSPWVADLPEEVRRLDPGRYPKPGTSATISHGVRCGRARRSSGQHLQDEEILGLAFGAPARWSAEQRCRHFIEWVGLQGRSRCRVRTGVVRLGTLLLSGANRSVSVEARVGMSPDISRRAVRSAKKSWSFWFGANGYGNRTDIGPCRLRVGDLHHPPDHAAGTAGHPLHSLGSPDRQDVRA
jgi:hypothetical protein